MLASIPSPSFNVFDIGPLTIHIYGILMGIAVAHGLRGAHLAATRSSEGTGGWPSRPASGAS